MCGITGLLTHRPVDGARLDRMTRRLAHRGPDGQGLWIDPEGIAGLGHRRLAVVDVTAAGAQPMHSHCGRYVLSFNGEIYNHAALRAELDAAGPRHWRGHCDTETLIEAIAQWGMEGALTRSAGMFALALWDRRERRLLLARDRFGEKPLYYGWVGGDFVFASELKSIRSHPAFVAEPDRRAVSLFTRRGYVPTPLSIYRHVYKLQPGCILTVDAGSGWARPAAPPVQDCDAPGLRISTYWCYADVVAAGLADPLAAEEQAIEQLETALDTAIREQSCADVPVGHFLSGGVDSATIVALRARQAGGPLRTFTLGIADGELDETADARRLALALGTDHRELLLTDAELGEVIAQLPEIYDEPFGDSSQIPTHVLCRFARSQVKVALGGDGGDELFGGYNRHVAATRYLPLLARIPSAIGRQVGNSLLRLPPAAWNVLLGRPPAHRLGLRARKALEAFAAADGFAAMFDRFLDDWSPGDSPAVARSGVAFPARAGDPGRVAPDAVRLMWLDATSYLVDDILTKVDRAAMAVGLETRMPYLDHRVAAVAARIPLAMKVRRGRGKHVLRQLLRRHAPPASAARAKRGFGLPVGALLRGPLRGWAADLLHDRSLIEQGFFEAETVRRAWQRHLDGGEDWSAALWSILMFQAWMAGSKADERTDLTRCA